MSEEQETRQEIFAKIKELDSVNNKYKAIALNHHLDKKKDLDEQLEKEMKALTMKYEKLSEPLYKASQEIIGGARGLTDEELGDLEGLTEEEKAKKGESQDNKDAIAGYWLKAFKNCDMIAPEIKEKDEEVLEKVTKVEYIPEGDDGLKFKVIFHFAANDFFDNETLTKEFVLKDDDEPEAGNGTEINWKEGKNITVKTVKKTQKNKKSGQKRVVTKEVEDESFFNFFKDAEAGEGDDEEDEEAAMAEEKLAIDFDVARALVDEVIPYSLEYFLGVKVADGEGYGDMDFGDDDDEDDEEEAKPKKGKKAHKKSSDSTKSKGSKGEEKPECKQQ